ncbi:MAG TPA: NF038122 family metalloprotease [Bryobacteraceae bacterium]|nr:NF038122 family metalloprotease [Bryobacteraceae bacterium]
MTRARLCLSIAALAMAGSASASPMITVLYDPTASFSTADKTAIQNAVNFYASNMTSNLNLTVAFGSQAGGGGSSEWSTQTVSYNSYYTALLANSSGDATDTAAIASLGGGSHVNNPVTGSTDIDLNTSLAVLLGLTSESLSSFGHCGGLSADACITISQAALNTGGSPLAGLGGIVQHEMDEVLGTASNLPNGGGSLPANPLEADLYRYSAPGVRSFALNTSTDVPCTGSPTAYLSVNGGVTNLNNYNNCNNGGDYGDWSGVDGLQVQDAFGPDSQAAALSLSSPEVALLDADGYNFVTAATAVPEPASLVLVFAGLAAITSVRKRSRPV